MKILHVVQSLDPLWGGIARVLPELAAGLAAQGERCTLATLAGGRFGTPPAVPGVEVLRFAAADKSKLGRSAEFSRRIHALVAEHDVVHLHGLWTGQNWAAGKAARKARKPYIMTPHSMMMPWAWKRSAMKKRLAGMVFEYSNLRHAALLHALSEGEAAEMRKLGYNSKIEVVPNGVHAAAFEHAPSADAFIQRHPETRGRRWIVFLGRISEQKGIVEAMQGCFDAAAASKDWHLIVAGNDEFGLLKLLQTAARRKGLAERVTFAGPLDRQSALAVLGKATLLLQPSKSEGLSMSILEAMASGVPVLISPACNMPEVEARVAGRIVEPHRGAISAALKALMAMPPADLSAMGGRGRTLIRERFDWAKVLPAYRKMYQMVASR